MGVSIFPTVAVYAAQGEKHKGGIACVSGNSGWRSSSAHIERGMVADLVYTVVCEYASLVHIIISHNKYHLVNLAVFKVLRGQLQLMV
jgi:hypothetical protein